MRGFVEARGYGPHHAVSPEREATTGTSSKILQELGDVQVRYDECIVGLVLESQGIELDGGWIAIG